MNWDYICTVHLDHRFDQKTLSTIILRGLATGFEYFDPDATNFNLKYSHDDISKKITDHIDAKNPDASLIFYTKYRGFSFLLKVSGRDIAVFPYEKNYYNRKINLAIYMEIALQFCLDFPIREIKTLNWVSKKQFMGYFVSIKKYRILDQHTVVYEVKAPDSATFHMKIDIAKQQVDMYELTGSIGTIDFNNPDKKSGSSWLSSLANYALFVKAKEVITSKNFPDDISFCS